MRLYNCSRQFDLIGSAAEAMCMKDRREPVRAGWKPAPGVSTFVPLSKGIEALRKLRRALCGRGSERTRTPSWSPPYALRKGEKVFLPLWQAGGLPAISRWSSGSDTTG